MVKVGPMYVTMHGGEDCHGNFLRNKQAENKLKFDIKLVNTRNKLHLAATSRT